MRSGFGVDAVESVDPRGAHTIEEAAMWDNPIAMRILVAEHMANIEANERVWALRNEARLARRDRRSAARRRRRQLLGELLPGPGHVTRHQPQAHPTGV
jgi:hypothetical protein